VHVKGPLARRGAVRVPGSLHRTNDLVSVAIGLQTALTTLLVATQSLPLAMAALFGGLVVLSISASAGARTGALVESDRLTNEGGVVVLREHVARIVASASYLRIDTLHGDVRGLALEGGVESRQVIGEIAAAWPELARFGEHTLYRVPSRRPSIPLADVHVREPFVLELAHRGDGYRDGGEGGLCVSYRGATPWSVRQDGDGLEVSRAGAPPRRLSAPLVLVHATKEGARILTANDEVVVPAERERDLRESVRLLRRAFAEAGPDS
jgi:hypothetical protein